MTLRVVPPPPALADLRAGTRLVAGLGYSTVVADLDFETYSEAGFVWDTSRQRWGCLPRASAGKKGLYVVGSARYAEHWTTEVLSIAYDLKDGRGRRVWRPGDPAPADLFDHIACGRLLEAWNVAFERGIWDHVCVPRLGWPAVPPHQWRCAMAKARAHALPGSLDKAGEVLGVGAQKDPRGKRLLDRFSVPRNPTRGDPRLRLHPEDDPDGPALYAYNMQDIAAEAEISSLTPDLPPDELEWWLTDQAINDRGVAIDTDAVNACIAIVEAALLRYDGELRMVTGGAVEAASQVARLTAWLHTQGAHLDSLEEEAVTAALAGALPPAARRALEIRALVGSASVKKLFAMANQVCADGRLRGLYTYHGARTGRTIGAGPQPTNLPAGGPETRTCPACGHHSRGGVTCPWCGCDVSGVPERAWGHAAVEDALAVVRHGSLDLLEMYFREALPTISGCLRGMFVARPGYDLLCSDYSAIEAVTLAGLAGEEWRREVFRTHGKIYEMSASKITGVPFEEFLRHKKETGEHHPLRKKVGKIAELASGFGGWVNAWKAFGADEFFTDEEIKSAILGWRLASPSIPEFWGGQTRNWQPQLFGVEGCFISAMMRPGQEFGYRGITYVMRGDAVYCRLLSGRLLTYHRPRLAPSDRRAGEQSISYEGWNTNPKNGPVGWIRMNTFGGRLTENIVQATARDIQVHGLIALERAGYPIVLHVYDEDVAEVPEGWGTIEEMEQIMSTVPSWAAGWPVRAAGGWRGKRYRKE